MPARQIPQQAAQHPSQQPQFDAGCTLHLVREILRSLDHGHRTCECVHRNARGQCRHRRRAPRARSSPHLSAGAPSFRRACRLLAASRFAVAAGSISRAASRSRASFANQAARRKSLTRTVPASTNSPSGRFSRRNGHAISRASSIDIATSGRWRTDPSITCDAARTSSLCASCDAHSKSWRVIWRSSSNSPNGRLCCHEAKTAR